MFFSLAQLLAIVCLLASVALADAPDLQPDKSAYTLFNPTPARALRDLNSDRPSVTTGPYTVDAGHFQVESSFLQYTYDERAGARTDTFDVLPTNLRVGTTSSTEIDVMIDPYRNIAQYGRNASSRVQGYGDMELQGKLNFWGDDGGASAAGVIPFISLPTGAAGISNHHVQGGLILPVSYAVADGLSIAGMAQFAIDRNIENTGYGLDLTDTVVLTKSLTKAISAYVEFVGVTPIETGRTFAASVDVGGAIQVTENLQFDLAVDIGISKSLPNFIVLSGFTFRI